MPKSCGCSSMKNNKKAAIYVLLFMLVFVGTIYLLLGVSRREGLANASESGSGSNTDASGNSTGQKMVVQPLPYAPGGSNPERERLNAQLQAGHAQNVSDSSGDSSVKKV
jgi:hypothetical protein